MDFSKLKNRLLIILCVFVVLFPFWCVRGLCAEEWEEIEYNYVSGIRIKTDSNVFTEGSNIGVGYIPVESDYLYKIVNTGSSPFPVAESNSIPVLNGSYNLLYNIESGGEYVYRGNSGYLYLDFRTNNNGTIPLVYKMKITSLDGAVNDLVDNINITSMFGVFENTIPYVLIAVTVAFGLYIIIKSLRGGSKGKGGA